MKRTPPKRLEPAMNDLEAILSRAEAGQALTAEDCGTLRAVLETLQWLTGHLEQKDVTLDRLRRLLFGPTSEKTN